MREKYLDKDEMKALFQAMENTAAINKDLEKKLEEANEQRAFHFKSAASFQTKLELARATLIRIGNDDSNENCYQDIANETLKQLSGSIKWT